MRSDRRNIPTEALQQVEWSLRGAVSAHRPTRISPFLYYRLYFFDRFSGHIDNFREFEAAGDASAVAQSAGWRELDAMELWRGRRKVKRWEAWALVPEVRARSAASALRAVS